MAYRSGYSQIMSTRLAELRLARELLAPHLPDLDRIFGRRVGRMAFGLVGIVGATSMFLASCVSDTQIATDIMLATWGAGALAYVVARAATPTVVKRVTTKDRRAITGNLEEDLQRFHPSARAEALAQRLTKIEAWSNGLPLTALSLLMPLTLHWLFWKVVGNDRESFATWIRISLIIVGHAHLTLAALSVAFARRVAKTPLEVLETQSIHSEWGRTWAFTVLVSCMPGILLFLVPPILSAITGLAFIPFMYVLTWRRLQRERRAIALAHEATQVRVAPENVPFLEEDELWNELTLEESLHAAR